MFWKIFLIALLSIYLFMLALGYFDKVYYKGPQSDHFDGKKFRNIDPDENNLFDLIRWKLFDYSSVKWPKKLSIEPGPKPEAFISEDNIRITLVNQSTFLIQTQNINILTDPIWSDYAGPPLFGYKRAVEPGIKFEDLPKIDFVLISHNHYDHLDIETIKKINKKFKPFIIAPLGLINGYLLDELDECNCHEMDWWEEKLWSNNLKITLVPAHHWSRRGFMDKNSSLWGGFMIEAKNKKIYFAGDTGYSKEGKVFHMIKNKFEKIDIALLPIGAYKPEWFMSKVHLSPLDALKVYNILDPQYMVPMHYGTFKLSDEGYNEPLQDLHKIINKDRHKSNRFKILTFGQPWDIEF